MRCAAIWLVFVAWSSCAGWILSAVGQLNHTGYAFALFPLLAVCAALWRNTSAAGIPSFRLKNPFRDSGTAAWMLVVFLSLVAGLLFAPSNYDALSYRLPRILYWLQENRWHWLEHADHRMNYSGTGFEWQMLPLLVFTGSDRLLFFLNWVPFLFLPALGFITLRFSGAGNRTAARWMWILPLCYGYALQSSSIGNDALGAFFVLASVAFCAIAVERKSPLALALAAIAAAALSGLKLSNLPLLLPVGLFWLTSAWKIKATLMNGKVATLSLPLLAALALTSFLPYAWLNQVHCGKWSGDPQDRDHLRITKTLPGLTGNLFNLTTGTLQLPVLPLSKPTKQKLLEPISGEHSLTSYIQTGFIRFTPNVGGEIPIEEAAGAGLGIALALAIPLLMRPSLRRRRAGIARWPHVATWVAVLAYMASLGSENTARLMLPYYPLMLASLLAVIAWKPESKVIARLCIWLPFLFLLPGLLLNPNRPLIPITAMAGMPGLPSNFKTRLASLNDAYDSRSDPLHAIRKDLPAECGIVGFAGGPDESAYSLFKPFGQRKIIEVHQGNADSFEWMVAATDGIQERTGQPWDEWLAQSPYSVVSSYRIAFKASVGRQDWHLLRRNQPTTPSEDHN